ncbi:MAG: hypothetical protein D6725_11190, partial [Planctomycetota bacterium]
MRESGRRTLLTRQLAMFALSLPACRRTGRRGRWLGAVVAAGLVLVAPSFPFAGPGGFGIEGTGQTNFLSPHFHPIEV